MFIRHLFFSVGLILIVGSILFTFTKYAAPIVNSSPTPSPTPQVVDEKYEAEKKFMKKYWDEHEQDRKFVRYVDTDSSIDETFMKKIMSATSVQKIDEEIFTFSVDSPKPDMEDVFGKGGIITKKKVGIVGKMQRGDTFFLLLDYVFDTDQPLCMNCRGGMPYYTYQLKGKEPVNIKGPFRIDDDAVYRGDEYSMDGRVLYDYIEERDVNKDGVKEYILHRVNPHGLGDSGMAWAGDTLLKIEKGRILSLVTLPIFEDALACGRCGDLDGRFYESTWEFQETKTAGYPDILLTKKLLFSYQNGEPSYPITETVMFTYDAEKKLYLEALSASTERDKPPSRSP